MLKHVFIVRRNLNILICSAVSSLRTSPNLIICALFNSGYEYTLCSSKDDDLHAL